MSINNPLFFILVVGASILSLILVTGSTSATIFAQDDEEKDDKDEKDKEKEEEKEESKDKEEEEEDDKDEKDKEESKEEEEKDENNNNDTSSTSTQIIQDQLTPSTVVNNNDTTASAVVNTTTTTIQPVEPIAVAPPEEETAIINKEFNATCKCMTTTSTTPPPSSKPIDPPTTTPPQPQNNNNQQIPITTVNIQDSKSFGQVTDPAYTSFYTVPNLLDNVINDVSFWSQAGQSSFYIKLDNTLDNYQVCSAELNVHNPKSSPYLLDIGVSQNYSGVIDQTNEKIQFEKCVKNMDEIYMIFDNPSGTFVSISEIKLFGSKLGATDETVPPTTAIPTLQPSSIPITSTENATKINIENSMAEVDIKNSTITFKFDPLTATFIGSK